MYWFFSFPNMETSLNDLAKDLEISKTTAKRIVEVMVEDDFLIKKIYGKTWRITCNIKHYLNHSTKIAFNLSMIYNAYNNGLKDTILDVVENAHSIILFGSYRKGDDNEKSDIDIAVEVSNDEDVKIVNLGTISHFGHRKNVPVNLHIFYRNKIDTNLFSNIANGIVIDGFLEVRPWELEDLIEKTHKA